MANQPTIGVSPESLFKNKNKDSEPGNKNLGRVVLGCLINEYCPFEKTTYSNHDIIFNSFTMEGVPDYIKSNISFVPGETGVYLKERHYSHSQFLIAGGEYLCLTKVTELVNSLKGNELAKFYHFIWDLEKNVFMAPTDTILRESQYGTLGASQATGSTYDMSRWECHRLDGIIADGDMMEGSDGKVIVPTQVAVSPIPNKRVHWRVVKREPIFQGEDFFVELKQSAFSKDASSNPNYTLTPFTNYLDDPNLYKTIDVGAKLSSTAADAGVVSYSIDNMGISSPVEDSRKLFDLHDQAYFIIEMGIGSASSDRYFVIITQRSAPRFVKVAKPTKQEASVGPVLPYHSYCIGEYTGANGDILLSSKNLHIGIRSHLGKIVITFSGYESDPWIITNSTIGSSSLSDDASSRILIVPEGKIALWGGSIVAGFSFGPITYMSSSSWVKEASQFGYKLALPMPGRRTDSNEEPYVVPGDVQVVFSQTDMGLSPTASPTTRQFMGGGTIRSNDKNPYYICDVQSVSEIRTVNISDEAQQRGPVFMDYTGIIKNQFTDEPEKTSFIKQLTEGYESRLDVELVDLKSIDKYTSSFRLKVNLIPGSHIFGKRTGSTEDSDVNNWSLFYCKTPVLTNIRLIGIPSKNNEAWAANTIDASRLVLTYTDNWAAQDYNKMEHSGNIRFLINRAMGKEAAILESYRNRAFYVQVFAGYKGCNYTQLEPETSVTDSPNVSQLYKMMTGICYGGTIIERAGERIMECKIVDYMKLFQDTPIFNSPFFDGVRDVNAIYELAKMTDPSLKEDGIAAPLSILKAQVNATQNVDQWGGGAMQGNDGRRITPSMVYALPHGYAMLQGEAEFRFNDGEMIMSGLEKISQRSGKILFFDVHGVLHYEAFPIANLLFNPTTHAADAEADPSTVSLWDFTASNMGSSGQLILNQVSRDIAVSDVYNNVHILTSSPNMELFHVDRINKPSIYNPGTEGFLGYRKTFYQKDGIFSSAQAADEYAAHLTKFYRPPVVYKVETPGLPMRCFDIANVDGQPLVVINIAHSLDAKENKWMTNIEGEWLMGEQGAPKT